METLEIQNSKAKCPARPHANPRDSILYLLTYRCVHTYIHTYIHSYICMYTFITLHNYITYIVYAY